MMKKHPKEKSKKGSPFNWNTKNHPTQLNIYYNSWKNVEPFFFLGFFSTKKKGQTRKPPRHRCPAPNRQALRPAGRAGTRRAGGALQNLSATWTKRSEKLGVPLIFRSKIGPTVLMLKKQRNKNMDLSEVRNVWKEMNSLGFFEHGTRKDSWFIQRNLSDGIRTISGPRVRDFRKSFGSV